MTSCTRKVQCKACPWRKDVDPERDIPGGYSVDKHLALKGTIARPGDLSGLMAARGLRVMACHETTRGHEQACVGWLVNQLGPGNNIALRFMALDGRFDGLRVIGEQHEQFEDTLPRRSVPL